MTTASRQSGDDSNPLFTIDEHHHGHHEHNDEHHHEHHHHDHFHDHDHIHGSSCNHHHADGWRQYLPHSHGLENRLRADTRSLAVALTVIVSASVLQLTGGIIANSSVLRVEALHSALDGITVVISLISVLVASRAPTARYTYGFSRAEVLSALVSVVALVLLCVKLFVEAGGRLVHILRGSMAQIHVEGNVVFVAEVVALTCNLFIACVLTRKGQASLNVRALRAHVIADSVENLVVLFAGFLMWVMPALSVIDPILTLLIVIMIIVLNFGIAHESIAVLLQGSPMGLDVRTSILGRVAQVEGVVEAERVHVWTLTSGSLVGSAVIRVDDDVVRLGFAEIERVQKAVLKVFAEVDIDEVTVQVNRVEHKVGGG